MNIAREAGVIELVEGDPAAAFTRDDPPREIPHNLFTNTQKLWVAAAKSDKQATAPQPVFTYDQETPKPSKKIASATIVFSSLATAEWRWQGGQLGPLPRRQSHDARERRRRSRPTTS